MDFHLLHTTLLRDVLYMLIGLFLLTITDTLAGNAGLSPLSLLFHASFSRSQTSAPLELSEVVVFDDNPPQPLSEENKLAYAEVVETPNSTEESSY